MASVVVHLVLAQVDDGQHRLVGEQEEGLSRARSSAAERRPVDRDAASPGPPGPAPGPPPRRPATCPAWPPCAACRSGSRPWRRPPAPAPARARPGRKADRCHRPRCRPRRPAGPGRGRRPRGCRRGTGCRAPPPSTTPATSPAMSTNSTVACTTLRLALITASWSSRWSGTWATPTVLSVVEKGWAATGADPPVRALNRLDFPELGSPTMPSRSISSQGTRARSAGRHRSAR